MDIVEKIIPAVIAGVVSLIIALIGIITTLIQVSKTEKRLISEIKTGYTKQLYEKRIALYPTAFKITSKIKKLSYPQGIISKEQQLRILKQLNSWAENDAGLFLSKEVISHYYKLRKSLGNNPGNGDEYTQQQIEKLWTARTEFRSALRYDISNLHHK